MCMTLQCKGIALGRSNSNENNIGSCLDYQSIPEDIDKVDVSQLIVSRAPTSLKQHDNLQPSDKITWDEAYSEEYFGLH